MAKRGARGRRAPGYDNFVTKNALHPVTRTKDFRVTVSGAEIHYFLVHRFPEFDDARHIPETIQEPDGVWESIDATWWYCRGTAGLNPPPREVIRRTVPHAVFMVEVDPATGFAKAWQFEDAAPGPRPEPADQGPERFTKRLV